MNWGTWLFADHLGEEKDYPPYLDHPKQYKPQTNADRIRAMSDEELVELLLDGCRGSTCSDQSHNDYGSVDCFKCRMDWLKQPVKDGESDG